MYSIFRFIVGVKITKKLIFKERISGTFEFYWEHFIMHLCTIIYLLESCVFFVLSLVFLSFIILS